MTGHSRAPKKEAPMKPLAELLQATRAIVRFRRRSIFMVLGIAIGIASLTVLDSIGENTRRETMKRVRNMLGTFDTVLIRPGGRSRGMVSLATVEPVLKFSDAAAIASELADIKQVATLQNAFDLEVSYRDRQWNPAVFGVSWNWLDLRGDQVEAGSFFSEAEEQAVVRRAVLGASAMRALFPNENWRGQTIRIADVPFQVQGVLAARGAGPAGADLDNIILIPVTTASKRLFNRDFATMIIAQLKNPEDGEKAIKDITILLRERHHLAATALDDFNVTSPRAVMDKMTSVATTLAKILKGGAVLVMAIGGIVIMSLMTLAVSQRRCEIGMRRAVGAGSGDILFQFLAEVVMISIVGGLLGTALGLAAIEAVAAYQKLPLLVEWGALPTRLSLAAAIGIAFGLYPAWRASRIDPANALRA
jgi:putative ABC transport system permease protein